MIAILQTAFLGDTLLTLPLAHALREQHTPPASRSNAEAVSDHLSGPVAIIVREGFRDLLRDYGLFDRIIEIKKGSSDSYAEARKELQEWWKDGDRKVLLSPHESPRSKVFAAKLRLQDGVTTIGYRDRWPAMLLAKIAYNDTIDRPMHLPEALRQLALLQSPLIAGEATATEWQQRLRAFAEMSMQPGGRDQHGELVDVPPWARMPGFSRGLATAVRSANSGNTVVLAPGSVWATKQWTETGFIEVGRSLIADGHQVAIIGTATEQPLCDRIAAAMAPGQAVSHAGRLTLSETLRLIGRAELAIVNDSGAMHLATSVGTPVVAIFGPTILDFGYRPWGQHAIVIEPPTTLACRPCGLHGSQRCPIGTHICMKSITAEKVLTATKTVTTPQKTTP